MKNSDGKKSWRGKFRRGKVRRGKVRRGKFRLRSHHPRQTLPLFFLQNAIFFNHPRPDFRGGLQEWKISLPQNRVTCCLTSVESEIYLATLDSPDLITKGHKQTPSDLATSIQNRPNEALQSI